MSKRKRLLFTLSLFAVMMVLSACGTEPITSESTGFWDRYIVFNFSNMIVWLSELFFGNYGLGIIAFTIIIRVILLPLNHFQTKSTKKMAAVQPQIKALQEKYASKDRETQERLQKEVSKLYADNDVNPYMGCLPVLVQMPVLMALYQAISRTEILKSGSFLWMNLGERDPFFILPIVAAILTYATSKLTMMSQTEANSATKSMTYTMPIMILMMGINFPSALSLYWVASNAFSVGQTMLLNNPFKAIREREEAEAQAKAREKALKKAQNPKKKKKN
ncbi:membrane protein insertase YidC [Trichococcus ilyis]|uniref:Membrane protein insertase YidC n=1 Tax=Trichococcus ilyis TaxID=640938 RepID=A0A143YAJ4_9LACT|nr:membrane protein insertase YidC [Trichococcus ilyis]CZQ85055.1 membrane insertase oxa1/alb3/yidc [Trichococcus ilyis]SEJ59154.1 YidC/Oxa1 family membrane protein insertase [Trichococcus ilyis]